MQKTNLVKEYISKPLKKYGFLYTGFKIHTWFFERADGEFKQTIMIDDLFPSELRLVFQTNAYQYPTRYARDIIPKEEYEGNIHGTWEYRTEEDFIQILGFFSEVIINYGISTLEEMSCHWTEARPTEEMERYLFVNYETLQKKYCEICRIKIQKKPNETINKIQETLVKEQEKPFTEVKNLLIGLAAIYGTVLEIYLNGTWKWDEQFRICIIDDLGKLNASEVILNIIILHWRDEPDKFTEYAMRNIKYWESR